MTTKMSAASVRCPRSGQQVTFVLFSDGSSTVEGCPYFRRGSCTMSVPLPPPFNRLPQLSPSDYVDGHYACPRCGGPLALAPPGIYVCPRDGSAYLPPGGLSSPCLFEKRL